MAIRAIILRHGQSSFNSQNRIQGRSDLSVLTERGLADATATGKAFAGIDLDAIYCSPLQRAKQTAETAIASMGADLQPIADPDLLEIDLPPWVFLPIVITRYQSMLKCRSPLSTVK